MSFAYSRVYERRSASSELTLCVGRKSLMVPTGTRLPSGVLSSTRKCADCAFSLYEGEKENETEGWFLSSRGTGALFLSLL